MLSLALLFVCQQDYAETILNRFSQIRWKDGTHGSRKKPSDFGGNPDHVKKVLGLRSAREDRYVLRGV